jgi:hypothetical protein
MHKLCFISVIFFLSCGQNATNKHKSKSPKSNPIDLKKDSTSQVRNAFHWSWDRPTGKILLPSSVTKFVAPGQEAIDTVEGDLNKDGFPDLAVMTGKPKEDSLRFSSHNLQRHLLIFLGQEDGGFRFIFRNEKAIPCINCCGMTDPYAGISIKEGQLTIKEYCASNWKSISEHRFRYASKLDDWLLDTVVTESYAFNYENYELDTTTKKDFGPVSLRTFVMYKDQD